MKKILILLLILLPVPMIAQKDKGDLSKYLAGAVPVTPEGYVYFAHTYEVPGKSKAELFELLRDYTQKKIVEAPDHLEQARITEADGSTGIIAASIEEYLYFKRKALTMDRVRFYYQLIYRIEDGKFNIEMRRLHYIYDDLPQPEDFRAEKWITDEEALNASKTNLKRISGKFRRFTIDRKDEIFHGAAQAAQAVAGKE